MVARIGRGWAKALMRFVYVDEAGISAKEPVTVVVGLVVQADDQWNSATSALSRLLLTVPEPLRNGFTSHATSVWNSQDYREAWSLEARREFLLAMMALPRRQRLPIALAVIRRTAASVEPGRMPLRREQFQHVMAFGMCIEQADDYVRRFCGEQEVATVIAEDVPEVKAWIAKLVTGTRDKGGWIVKPEHQRPTKAQIESGDLPKERFTGIKRVIDTVHFVGKREAPLLQVADACAFGFRRYFADLSFGTECVRAIVGQDLVRDDWQAGMSQFTFYPSDQKPRSAA